jgi:hypothetical protein
MPSQKKERAAKMPARPQPERAATRSADALGAAIDGVLERVRVQPGT